MLAMLGVCALSGFAGTLMEMLLKERSLSSSLWIRNLQMSLFSLPIAAAAVPLSDAHSLRVDGPWVGFNPAIVAVVLLAALGGLVTSVALRYADNLLKSFAVGLSIALSCVLSRVFLQVLITRHSVVGIVVVGTRQPQRRSSPHHEGPPCPVFCGGFRPSARMGRILTTFAWHPPRSVAASTLYYYAGALAFAAPTEEAVPAVALPARLVGWCAPDLTAADAADVSHGATDETALGSGQGHQAAERTPLCHAANDVEGGSSPSSKVASALDSRRMIPSVHGGRV